jgi:hypothetical protein
MPVSMPLRCPLGRPYPRGSTGSEAEKAKSRGFSGKIQRGEKPTNEPAVDNVGLRNMRRALVTSSKPNNAAGILPPPPPTRASYRLAGWELLSSTLRCYRPFI